ncbi:MAG: AMP-binding protein, partial [Candidatus Kariarchaeaceae archaeon]
MYTFDWLAKRAKLSPDKIALIDLETDRKFTYKQFNERASYFANFILNKLGLKPGDRIAILAYNSSDYMEILYGCAKAGLILVCLNWRLAVPELEFILKDSTPKALIYDSDFNEVVNNLRKL